VSDRTRKLLGVAIMLASIALLFWWGFQFGVFGNKPDLLRRPVAYGGFMGWMVVGMFGFGLGVQGPRSGLKLAAGTLGVLALAFLIGLARGAYN
jgi:hypothetical protein